MVDILLYSKNQKEMQILLSAFHQYGYSLMKTSLSYNEYLRCLQASPQFVLIELDLDCGEQMKFLKLLLSHPNTKEVKVIAFGYMHSIKELSFINNAYISKYFSRPLKFSTLLSYIKESFVGESKTITESENASRQNDDHEELKNPKVGIFRKLQIIYMYSSQFLAFPFTLSRILQITNDPSSGAKELAKTIEADPVIASYVLKTANSVFFSSFYKRISSMKDAIVRIGFKETRRIVLCIGVMELFSKCNRNIGFDRRYFWLHSISVAVTTEVLFTKCSRRLDLTEYAFLAGLLHDFGTIVLDEFFPDIFKEILYQTTSTGSEFSSVCNKHIGIYPHDIASEFFRQWELPAIIKDVARFKVLSYDSLFMEKDSDFLGLVLHVAHVMTKSLSLGHSCDQYIYELPYSTCAKIKLFSGITDTIIDLIITKIRSICQFVNIGNVFIRHPFAYQSDYRNTFSVVYLCFSNTKIMPHYLYLRTLGYSIKVLANIESVKGMSEDIDLLVVSLGGKSIDKITGTFDSSFFSLDLSDCYLFISDYPDELEGTIQVENVSFVNSSIDARLLGKRVHELLDKSC